MPLAGSHRLTIKMPESVSTAPVVLRWISGKATPYLQHTPPTPVQQYPRVDVQAMIAEAPTQPQDMLGRAMPTDAISTRTARVIPLSMERALLSTPPRNSLSSLNSSEAHSPKSSAFTCKTANSSLTLNLQLPVLQAILSPQSSAMLRRFHSVTTHPSKTKEVLQACHLHSALV